MNGFAPVLFAVIWIIFVSVFFKGAKNAKRSANVKKPPEFTPTPVPRTVPREAKKKVSARPAKNYKGVSIKDSSNNMFLEDRNNDWLAKQIKEERKILSRSDMLDLGAAHEKACQADQLRRLHVLEHDDSIDTAQSR